MLISMSGFGLMMMRRGAIIGAMLGLSCALSILLVLLLRAFPKPVFYALIGISFAAEILLVVVGFLICDYGLGISFIAITMIQAILLADCWKYVEIGLKLVDCASRFITEKPAVYGISILLLVINIGFLAYWVELWMTIFSIQAVTPIFVMGPVLYLWYADLAFWGFFFYYCLVFLIATSCAYWYYNLDENSVLAGLSKLKYHLGSITYGSFAVIFTTLLRLFTHSKKTEGPGKIIASCSACCLACIKDFIKALNCNSIIVMAITSEGYIGSAKTATSLIFDNLGVFTIVDYFNRIYSILGVVLASIIPALIGGFLIYNNEIY